MAAPHRVVVTGLGVISSIGRTAECFWASLVKGQPGIAPLQHSVHRIDSAPLRFQNVAEVRDFNAEEFFDLN